MRNTVLFALIALISLPASAQLFKRRKGEDPIINMENFDKRRFTYGYFLGFNQYDFKFDYIDDEGDVQVASTTGFNVGLIGNMRLHKYLDLRLEPGIYFTTRELGFPNNAAFSSDNDRLREVKSTYIHVPLLLKFNAKRYNNIRPNIFGGVSTSLNLSSNEDNPDDNASGTFRMKRSTFYYEFGIGLDFYTPYFKFTPSVRGVFALSDELVRDNDPNSPWTSNIDQMSTRGVFVNFTFQ